MPDPSQIPWSNKPNAPQIIHEWYLEEKAGFAGVLIGAICYGIVIALFFQYLSVSLDAFKHGRKGTKWGFVAHAAVMFSFVTIYTAINFDSQSFSYIDSRRFPGDDTSPPGTYGYLSPYYLVLSCVSSVLFFLNNWLADGILLYRCYVIYDMNRWVIAFPCLMYLTSIGMGIILLSQGTALKVTKRNLFVDAGLSYFSVSVSLNILLTLMIVVRLVIHCRNFRKATGATHGSSQLYKTAAAVLVESYALYAISFLSYVVSTVLGDAISLVFFYILAEAQVLAPYLVLLRVTNRKAVTSEDSFSGNVGSIRFRSQGSSTGDDGPNPPDENPVGPTDGSHNELGVGDENVIEEVPL